RQSQPPRLAARSGRRSEKLKADLVLRTFPSSSAAVGVFVSPDSAKPKGFLVHLAGHVLLFERRPAPDFNASTGMRLLAVGARCLFLAPRDTPIPRYGTAPFASGEP